MSKAKDVQVVKSDANLPAEISNLTGLGQAASAAASDLGTGDAFGQFNKQGEWLFGQEKIQTEEGSVWAVNPLSLCHGWIFWPESGRPTERMVKATMPLPREDELPEKDNGEWVSNYSFQARCVNGEDIDQQVIWKGSSMGFAKSWAGLAQAIATQAVAGAGEVVAMVELESDSYTHGKYGKIMTPDIRVQDWATMEAAAEAAEPDPEPEPEPEPAEEEPKPKKKATAKKAEKKPAPTRRRRVKK